MNRPISMVLLVAGASALALACSCEPNTITPSTDTVDQRTHAPYQMRQPLTTGNPMSDTPVRPDFPCDEAIARKVAVASGNTVGNGVDPAGKYPCQALIELEDRLEH